MLYLSLGLSLKILENSLIHFQFFYNTKNMSQLCIGGWVQPMAVVRLKELLAVARTLEGNAKILKTILQRVCLPRHVNSYLAMYIFEFVRPISLKSWYIPDFMNFFSTNGNVTCDLALPLIHTICPQWTDEPPTTETAISIMIELYRAHDKSLKRMPYYIDAVEREEKRARA